MAESKKTVFKQISAYLAFSCVVASFVVPIPALDERSSHDNAEEIKNSLINDFSVQAKQGDCFFEYSDDNPDITVSYYQDGAYWGRFKEQFRLKTDLKEAHVGYMPQLEKIACHGSQDNLAWLMTAEEANKQIETAANTIVNSASLKAVMKERKDQAVILSYK